MERASTTKAYIVISVVAVLVVFFHYAGILQPVEEGVRGLLSPSLLKIHDFSVQVNDRYEFFKDKDDFLRAYETCRKNDTEQDERAAQIKLLTQQNNELREQLGFIKKSDAKHVIAEIIGKDSGGSDSNILINSGSNEQIQAGDPVIVGSGTIIGTIVKVDGNSSVVQLLSDNNSKVAVSILNHDASLGVVEGGYGISLRVNLIPRDETVLVGDQVISSGLDPHIPRGLLIGSVAVVENEPYQPFQQAILTPGADVSKLNIVTVLLTHLKKI